VPPKISFVLPEIFGCATQKLVSAIQNLVIATLEEWRHWNLAAIFFERYLNFIAYGGFGFDYRSNR
jgi:hypothetical protein